MKSLTLLASLLITSAAFAGFADGHDRGNGGDALICKNPQGKITSAHFFDLYEAQEKFDMKLVPPAGATLDEKVLNLIDRVASVDPIRAKVMKVWYKTFEQESSMKSGITLVDVPDTGDAFWPNDCELAQLVVQTELELPLNPYRYLFSKDIWQLLDLDNKAATIVHELLWREARMARHKTSAAIRYFNGLFLSDGFKNLLPEQYERLIQKLGLLIRTSEDGFPVGEFRVYEGVAFAVGPAHFIMRKTKNPPEYGEDRFTKVDGYTFAEALEKHISTLDTPSAIESADIEYARVDRNKLQLAGKFFFKGVQFKNLTYNFKDSTWTLSNILYYQLDERAGLQAVINKSQEVRYTMVVENVDTITGITDFQANTDGTVKSVTSKYDQTFTHETYYTGVRRLTCAGMTSIEFKKYTEFYSLSSCVSKYKTVLENEDGKKVTVPAGKRVYVWRDLRLRRKP